VKVAGRKLLRCNEFVNHTDDQSLGVLVSQDINVLALVKGEERYLFLFNDETRAETLRTLGRFASNPELSFTWYDAAVLSQKVRSNRKVSQQSVAMPVLAPRFELPPVTDLFPAE
jgi:hypothetical protein